MTGFAFLVIAAGVLAFGADLFVDNVGAIASRLSVRATAVALVVAGAEPEELVTSVLASGAGHVGLAAGDAIGASITAITLVLGLAILLGLGVMDRMTRRFARLAALLAAVATLALADGRLSRAEGAVLVAAYLPIVVSVLRDRRNGAPVGRATAAATSEHPAQSGGSALLGLVGVVAMTIGGWLAVSGAERVAGALGRTDGAVGLTLLALTTSAELLALVWATARRGATELLAAAVLGSVAFNTTLTLGAAALVAPGAVANVGGSAVFLTFVTGGVAIVAAARSAFPRPVGLVLILAYAAFIALTLGPST